MRYFRAVFRLRGEPEPLLLGATTEGEEEAQARRRRNRRARGWDGELPAGAQGGGGGTVLTLRRNSAGAAEVRAAPVKRENGNGAGGGEGEQQEDGFEWGTSLEEVSERTNLRREDVAFALVESGLAVWRRTKRVKGEFGEEEEEEEVDELVITPELVEEVAVKRKVKPVMVMELAHVLL